MDHAIDLTENKHMNVDGYITNSVPMNSFSVLCLLLFNSLFNFEIGLCVYQTHLRNENTNDLNCFLVIAITFHRLHF